MRFLLITARTGDPAFLTRALAAAGLPHAALDHARTPSDAARLLAGGTHRVIILDEELADPVLRSTGDADRIRDTLTLILVAETAPPSQDATEEHLRLTRDELTPALLRSLVHVARRGAGARARDTDTFLQLLQETARIGIWDWDLRTQSITWCPNLFRLFGSEPSARGAALHEQWLQAIHPDDRAAAEAAVASAIADHTPLDIMFRIGRPDAEDAAAPESLRWIHCKGRLMRDAAGSPVRLIGVNIEVTERHEKLLQAEASRKAATEGRFRSETRFQTFFENSPNCMFYLRHEPDGRFVYEAVNPIGLAATGFALEEIRGRTPQEVLGPEKGGTMTEGLRQVVRTGQPYHYEPTWQMAHGTVTYDASYMPLRDERGRISGILGVARDITERRQMEHAMHQLQKMDALGRLASGVAHDFNNLLSNVLACFTLLERRAESRLEEQILAEGLRTVERGQALVQHLLAFSRQQPISAEPVDLNMVLQNASGMLTRALGSNVRMELRLATDLGEAVANRNQVELAILNLAINARDAMPGGGRLTVTTRNVTVAEHQADGVAPGDYAAVAVTDEGCGMPPEVLARVLEPFFTTKEEGKGTGLGLSMVYGMVRQVGGGIQIASEPGRGTTVTLYFAQPSAGGETSPGVDRIVGGDQGSGNTSA